MKKILIIFFPVFLQVLNVFGQCDAWVWSDLPFGATTLDLAVDDEGNSYNIGWVSQTSSFNGESFPVQENFRGLFINKINSEGEGEWIQTTEGSIYAVRPSLATFGDQIYGVFSFFGEITWDGIAYNSPSGQNASLLVALNKEGETLWTKLIEGTEGIHHCGDIAVDDNGNIYHTGRMGNALTIESEALVADETTLSAVYLIKMMSDGTLDWIVHSEGSTEARGWALTIDQEQNVVVGGQTRGAISFGNNDFDPDATNNVNPFIAKFDTDGSSQWLIGYPSKTSSTIYGISADEDNNILITGSVGDSTLVNGQWIEAKGINDGFIARILPFGVTDWFRQFGAFQSSGGEWSTAINVTNEGNYIVTGQVTDGADFGSDTLYVSPFQRLRTAIATYNADGELLSLLGTGGAGWHISYGAVLKEDFLYINGNFLGRGMFGNDTVFAIPSSPDTSVAASFLWKVPLSEMAFNVESDIDSTYLYNGTYQYFNSSSSEYDKVSWNTNNDGFAAGIDTFLFSFEEAGGYFVCQTLSNCWSRQSSCLELILEEDDFSIAYQSIGAATEIDGSGAVLLTGNTYELRGVVQTANSVVDGYRFALNDGTGSVEVVSPVILNNYVPEIGDSIHIIGAIDQVNGMGQVLVQVVFKIQENIGVKPAVFVTALTESLESQTVVLDCIELGSLDSLSNDNQILSVSQGEQTFFLSIPPTFTFDTTGLNNTLFAIEGVVVQESEDDLLSNYLLRVLSQEAVFIPTQTIADFTFTDEAESIFIFNASPNNINTLFESAQWLINDEVVSTESSYEHQLSGELADGLTVCYEINGNECYESLQNCQTIIQTGAYVVNNSFAPIVFPNPANNRVQIESNELITALNIIDGKGCVVQQKYYSNALTSLNLDVGFLENGLYFIQLITDKQDQQIVKLLIN